MGIILSYIYCNICSTCNGSGKYPSYRECYDCRGTGFEYSVRRGFRNTVIPYPPSKINGKILDKYN